MLCAGDTADSPLLHSAPQNGSWFCTLYLLVLDLPQLHAELFLALVVSLYLVAGGDVCPGAAPPPRAPPILASGVQGEG